MKLPSVTGQQAVEAFGRIGRHIILRHSDPPHRRLTIPLHNPLAKGTLRALIRDAGLTLDQFIHLL